MITRLKLECPNCSRGMIDETLLCSCGHRLRMTEAWISSLPKDFVPPGFSRGRQEALSTLEAKHFWFAPRDKLLGRLITRHGRHSLSSVAELGCGTGRFLPTLCKLAEQVVGVEGHEASLHEAVARKTRATLIHSDVTHIPLAGGQFDLAVALDVLEHVSPDEFLQEARRLVKPKGCLLLSVPAFQSLWSDADRIAGHRCRYDLPMLTRELHSAGWSLIGYTYYQTILFPLMMLSRRIAPGILRGAERKPTPVVSNILEMVNFLEVELSSRVRMPFGSSLIAWAQ